MPSKLLTSALIGGGAFLLLRGGSGDAFATTNPVFPTQYDGFYSRNCKGIPMPYLRALTKNESDFNPREADGPAWGLMQVVESVRRDYNKRFSTTHSRGDLLNPNVNTKIACDLIRRIATLFAKRYPKAFPRGVDWRDPRFAQLVTFGWNAGWSDVAGVGFMIKKLEGRFPASSITIDKVSEQAAFYPQATRHLSNQAKVRWSKKVVADYFRQMAVG